MEQNLMPNFKFLEVALTMIGIHFFIYLIMDSSHIFTKSENPFQLECKSKIQNVNAYSENIQTLSCNLVKIKKMKYNFQQPTNLTNRNILYCPPTSYYLSCIKQICLVSNTAEHFTNSSLSLHISSQAQHTIFDHVNAEFFLFSSHFMFSIFDFSVNNANNAVSQTQLCL